MGIVFRSALPTDLKELAVLMGELGYPSTEVELSGRLARLLSEPAQAVIVALEEGRIRGVVQVQESLSLTTEPGGLVTGLVVAEEARGRGVGRELMEAAEDWGRARGLRHLRLRARVTRERAHAFYRRLGYRANKEQVLFQKEL